MKTHLPPPQLSVSRKQWITQGIITLFIVASGIFLFLKFEHFSWQETRGYLNSFTASVLFAALGLAIFQFIGLGLRLYSVLFAQPERPSLRSILSINSYGQIVNHSFPARSGDLFKVLMIHRRLKDFTIAKALAALTTDGIAHLLSLAFLLGLTAYSLLLKKWHAVESNNLYYFAGIGAVALAVFALLRLFLWRSTREFFSMIKENLISRFFLSAFALGFAVWLLEASSLLLLAKGLNVDLSLTSIFVVLFTLSLGIAVPLSFANIGTFEAGIVFGLTQFGVPFEKAFAIAIAHHILQMSAAAILSFTLFTINRLSGRGVALAKAYDE